MSLILKEDKTDYTKIANLMQELVALHTVKRDNREVGYYITHRNTNGLCYLSGEAVHKALEVEEKRILSTLDKLGVTINKTMSNSSTEYEPI